MIETTSIPDDNGVESTPSRSTGICACFGLKKFFNRLKSRKSMGQLQTEIDTENALRRALSWFHLTGIGVAATIGAGIFVLSGTLAAKVAGPSVILSFIIAGVVAILSALSFSELSAMMCHSGAAYTYTYAALGEYMAWFIGWNYALAYQFSASTVVVTWGQYILHLVTLISNNNASNTLVESPIAWNETGTNFYVTGEALNLPAIAITVAITVLLLSGIRATAIVDLVLVIFKIIVLLIFIFTCSIYVKNKNYEPFFPPNQGKFGRFGATGMLGACTRVFFAYVGFDCVATVAQEAKKPTTISIPFAIIASVVISAVMYVGIATVMVGLASYKSLLSYSPLSEAIKVTPYGVWLLILIDLGGIAALTNVALTMLLSQTRIFYAMASDGLLPKFFSKICSHTETPWISILISGAFCAVISGILPVDILGETASISALITYFFVHIEVMLMRFTHPDMPRTFRVPLGSWLVPTVGSLLCITLMLSISRVTAYRFLAWTGLGQIFYFSYGFWHSKKRERPPKKAMSSVAGSPPPVSTITVNNVDSKCQSDVNSVMSDSFTEEIIVQYF